jgi:hypothetical protein
MGTSGNPGGVSRGFGPRPPEKIANFSIYKELCAYNFPQRVRKPPKTEVLGQLLYFNRSDALCKGCIYFE